MTFSVFLPPQATKEKTPALLWLSGLTCTDENFLMKAGAQRYAAEYGVALICPDTSPRGDKVADDPEQNWDFGLGAGFYLNATEQPWSRHYHMQSYIIDELLPLIAETQSIDIEQLAISGHSMGGHGALTLGLKYPKLFKSISAFSPICSPSNCPWGQKAFTHYLGANSDSWQDYDTCALIRAGKIAKHLLVEQGLNDEFLQDQLKTELLEETCKQHSIPLTLNYHVDYDHSYYFISSFIGTHFDFHFNN